MRQILRSQQDVARYDLTVWMTETHQLVGDRSHSRPIRDDKLSGVVPRAFHGNFRSAFPGDSWLHQAQNINRSGKVSVIRKLELGERKPSGTREQRFCGIACHNDDELCPQPSVVGELGEFRTPEPSTAMPVAIYGIDPQLHTFEGNTEMNGGDRVSAFMNGRPLDWVYCHIVKAYRVDAAKASPAIRRERPQLLREVCLIVGQKPEPHSFGRPTPA